MEFNELGQPVGAGLENWATCPKPEHKTLHGRYGYLEPLSIEKHAADLFAANSYNVDGGMWTYLPYGPFSTGPEYQAWMETTCLGNDPLFYAVVDNNSKQAVGLTSYLRIIPEHGTIEIGHVAYSPRMQRTPLSTEATHLLLDYAFSLGYRRVEWKCNALNKASRAAARRVGFSFEGVFRQHAILKKRSRDTSWYAITHDEWPLIAEAHQRWLAPSNFDADGQQRLALSELTASLRKPAPVDD